MAFSQNKTSTSNKLAKHKPSTYMVYLFVLGVKREDGYRIIRIFLRQFLKIRDVHTTFPPHNVKLKRSGQVFPAKARA